VDGVVKTELYNLINLWLLSLGPDQDLHFSKSAGTSPLYCPIPFPDIPVDLQK
jgi:hypothetical protein